MNSTPVHKKGMLDLLVWDFSTSPPEPDCVNITENALVYPRAQISLYQTVQVRSTPKLSGPLEIFIRETHNWDICRMTGTQRGWWIVFNSGGSRDVRRVRHGTVATNRCIYIHMFTRTYIKFIYAQMQHFINGHLRMRNNGTGQTIIMQLTRLRGKQKNGGHECHYHHDMCLACWIGFLFFWTKWHPHFPRSILPSHSSLFTNRPTRQHLKEAQRSSLRHRSIDLCINSSSYST